MPDAIHLPAASAAAGARPRTAEAGDAAERLKNLELALDSMPQGLCFFDKDNRLRLFNTRYLEMYGLRAEDIKIGWTINELIRHRKTTGTFAGDPDQYVNEISAQLRSGKMFERMTELSDGRFIVVTDVPVQGGGWIATHRDVTPRVHAERDRDRAKAFLDEVIANVPAVILVKDARTLRYVLINRKAEEYFGLAAKDVIGKTSYDLFDKDAADQITANDKHAMTATKFHEIYSTPLHDSAKSQQVICIRRAVVRNPVGEPEYLVAIIEDVTERTRAAERVAHMARHDALTGLGNRILITEAITEAAIKAGPTGASFNLLLLDLDQFKHVNDSLGHPVGDALLKAVAVRLKTLLGKDDLVVRLSGDEFAIMQWFDGDQREAAVDLANRIHEAILEPFEIEGHQLIIGTTVGISFSPEHGEDADQLIKCADLALYRAKFAGRNQHRFFESTMEKEVNVRRTLELELRRALADNEFELRYQPVVSAATQEICGVEALVRWNSPVRGLVPPDRFIALAEETGLIVPLGELVMRQACADAAGWPDNVKVAVNLSAVQFSKGDLVGLVSRALDETGLAPERLELEITETVLLHKNEDNIALLHALKDLGVSIVLDDFGTGYSSLGYLKMFPFDKIKIDRSFVNELSTRMDCAAIVSAVAGLGRSLNIKTTAEGVETQEQFILLRAVGCTQIQGFLFGRPVPAAELKFTGQAGAIHRTVTVSPVNMHGVAPAPAEGMELPRQIA